MMKNFFGRLSFFILTFLLLIAGTQKIETKAEEELLEDIGIENATMERDYYNGIYSTEELAYGDYTENGNRTMRIELSGKGRCEFEVLVKKNEDWRNEPRLITRFNLSSKKQSFKVDFSDAGRYSIRLGAVDKEITYSAQFYWDEDASLKSKRQILHFNRGIPAESDAFGEPCSGLFHFEKEGTVWIEVSGEQGKISQDGILDFGEYFEDEEFTISSYKKVFKVKIDPGSYDLSLHSWSGMYNCTLDVYFEERFELNKKKAELKPGKTLQLKMIGKDGEKVTWSTSDKRVAKVTRSGKVTAVKKGKAVITASCGGRTATCRITVPEG